MALSIYPSIIYLSVCLSIYLLIYLSITSPKLRLLAAAFFLFLSLFWQYLNLNLGPHAC
jgi:hypothetical protein